MTDRLEILRNSPLFGALSLAELRKLQSAFSEQVFHKGQVICEIGDEGEMMYVVVSGELEAWSLPSPTTGERRRLDLMEPGDVCGETALFLGGKRAARVVASQLTRTLTLDKAAFQRHILTNPKALEYLSRVIAQRLVFTGTGRAAAKTTTVISVVSGSSVKGKSLVAAALAALIKDFSGLGVALIHAAPERGGGKHHLSLDADLAPGLVRTRLAERGPLPTLLNVGIDPDAPDSVHGERFASLITVMADQFAYIVCDLGLEPLALRHDVEEFSDFLVDVLDSQPGETRPAPAGSMRRMEVINLYGSSERIAINSCEPFVLQHDPGLLRQTLSQQIETIRAQPRASISIPLHRLARKILGCTVGVALGGGAAFGIAHIGVLKVLEENGIPVDVVAGCSFGSMIAAAYTSGASIAQLTEMAHDFGKRGGLLRLMDFSIQAAGLLKGAGLKACLSRYIAPNATFEDLLRPCRIIATDIHSGERIALGTGALGDAFRASGSVPVVWAPVEHQGRVLVDGGVSDPVPADVVRNMGADIVIAVNVVPPLQKGVESSLSKAYRRLKQLNPLVYLYRSFSIPSMFDTVMNSLQTLQHELGNFKAISADVRINPVLTDFTWVDFDRADELIDHGVQAAASALPAIRNALSQKTREQSRDPDPPER